MTHTHPLIGKVFSVLDYGEVTLIDFMGDDDAIAEAAWVSTEGVVKKRSPVPQFLDYLMRHRHWSPFEMCEVKLRLKVPLAMQAQIATHRTASRNQASGRYVKLPRQNYNPLGKWRVGTTGHNKQGSDAAPDPELQARADEIYMGALETVRQAEDQLHALGIAPEMCRFVETTSQYTVLYWKINLRNLMNFLAQRLDDHAQQETRDYAAAIETIAEALFPQAMAAWRNHVRYAVTFSREEQELLARLIACGMPHLGSSFEDVVKKVPGGRKSQQEELLAKLNHVMSAY